MKEPWYKDGLHFKCTGCGKCCTGGPGHVWIDEDEIQEMAKVLEISSEEFLKKYTRLVNGRRSLIEMKRGSNHDCVFLNGKQCSVYQARPQQCRTFPWWDVNLESKRSWKEAATYCEGINHAEAPLISLEKIQESLGEKVES